MADPKIPSPQKLSEDAELLLRGTPAQILERIAKNDPLGLRARVAAVLERRCLLLDPDRLLLLAMADVARFACRWGGVPGLATWLERQVDGAVDQLLSEEARVGLAGLAGLVQESPAQYGAGSGLPPIDDVLEPLMLVDPLPSLGNAVGAIPVLQALARPLGLRPDGLRAVCTVFNERPEAERRAFERLVLNRESLDAVALAEGSSANVVGRRARRVLEAILGRVAELPDGGLEPTSGTTIFQISGDCKR
ncbi:MAG: hypothetical protein ACI9HE_002037 [Planctomycetota bacterium]|jgi:hypothetical protein